MRRTSNVWESLCGLEADTTVSCNDFSTLRQPEAFLASQKQPTDDRTQRSLRSSWLGSEAFRMLAGPVLMEGRGRAEGAKSATPKHANALRCGRS